MDVKIYTTEDIGSLVELISNTGSELSIVNTARVSFDGNSTQWSPADRKLLLYLIENKHETPLEHTLLQFRIKCPLFIARQWHRHRVGISINEESGRYIEAGQKRPLAFFIPSSFRKQHEVNKQASTDDTISCLDTIEIQNEIRSAIETECNLYEKMRSLGIAREQARMVFSQNMITTFLWTCNVRSLIHFLTLRDHPHAQHEMQLYAQALGRLAEPYYPHIFSKYKCS